MRIPVSAVLLDLDGTLLDHDGAAHAAFLSARAVWLAETDRFTWDAADALFAVYLKEYEASWRAFDDVPEAMRFLHQAPGGVAVLSNG